MKKVFFIIVSALISHLSFSQALKLGYVYDDYIMTNFSEVKALQNEVTAKRQGFEVQLQAKSKDYQDKYALYQASLKDIANVTTESLNASVKELQEMKKSMEDYQTNAQQELQKTIQTKFGVIREKVNEAIKKTAAEKGYKFVFRRSIDATNRESTPIMLYANDNGRDNLSDAVLVKLGSAPPVKATVPTKPTATTPKAKVAPKK